MARPNGNRTPRSPHESAYKSPENRALLWANLLPVVQELFNTLRSPDPTQNIDAFTSDLESKIDVNADRGILTQISATNSINFSFLSTEVIHLDEIKTSDLTNIPGLQDPNLVRTFETALVKLIKNKLWSAVPGAIKRAFNQAINYHTTLIPLINAIEQFADTFNKEAERNEYKKLISDFKFTYEDIRQSLASEGFDTSALQTANFQSRTPDQKKLFDTMLSRTVVKRLQNRVNLMDRLITDTKDVFNNVLPPFHVIFNQYPFDREQLKAKYPNEFQDIEQMETQLSTEESEEGRKLLSAQIEQKFREIYLHDLQISKPILANTLQKLYTHQFDFSTLTPTESSELFSGMNKIFAPFKTAELPIKWQVGYDKITDIIEASLILKLISKAGAFYTVGSEKLQWKEKLSKYLESQEKVRQQLETEIQNKIKDMRMGKKVLDDEALSSMETIIDEETQEIEE